MIKINSWKDRFRIPFIQSFQIASHAPQVGLVAGNFHSPLIQLYAWDVPSGSPSSGSTPVTACWTLR